MNWQDFNGWAKKVADWATAYHQGLRDRPVRSANQPGDTLKLLPISAPEAPEDMAKIFEDVDEIIMPGMTHWQHPRFFAYFQSNAAPASMIAEMMVTSIAAQCMLWQTSPAATELEIRMMDWLRQGLGLPTDFKGVIQDSASAATLAAVLMMRNRALDMASNRTGLAGQPAVRIYGSAQLHSSIDKAIWIAGVGQDNLVKIPVQGPARAMDLDALEAAIKADLAAGLKPGGIMINVGGTSVGATDDVAGVIALAKKYDLLTHVDAAWAGSAMICPEYRYLWEGVEGADSIVFNPHKWLGANFDCSAHFVRDPALLIATLGIQPEYLKTYDKEGVTDFSEWSVPLGRRFRALKLWFLMRAYGMEGLRSRIRNHVAWANELAERLRAEPEFEIFTEPMLSLFSFRYCPKGEQDLDAVNLALLQAINDDGRIYLTQTKIDGALVIRFVAGQFDMAREDMLVAGDTIIEIAAQQSI